MKPFSMKTYSAALLLALTLGSPLTLWAGADWATDLKITDSHWSKSAFGVATWRLRIKNSSKQTSYKDPHFKTVYYAPSDTKVDESFIGHTDYVTLPAGKTVSITFTEFTHSQSVSATIDIDHADYEGH
jgi:hypothetical protein